MLSTEPGAGQRQCYDEFVKWMRDLVQEGRELDAEMREDERAELLSVLLATDDGRREAVDLGLIDEDSQRRVD